MKVLVADLIAQTAIDELKKEFEVLVEHYSPEQLKAKISEFDAIIVRSATKITRDMIQEAKKLKVIGRAGVGVDNIDVEAATEKNIAVVNSPRASTYSVAEMAMTFMLSLSRKIVEADTKTKQGLWPKKQLKGRELYGKTLGFVGCGRIGSEVAKRARAFGMECVAYDPYLPKEIADKVGVKLISKLEEVLEIADYISIHALLTDETKGMIGKKEFDRIKPSAYLINCARGGIVDEDALYNALKEKKIAGAGLDVFQIEPAKENKLFELENVYVSPHIAASTIEAQERAGEIIAQQIKLVLGGKKPEFCVNMNIYD
ncbi:MAG: hydroxyacid dehydrogenase [Candidatus Hodarchaeales archaeon]